MILHFGFVPRQESESETEREEPPTAAVGMKWELGSWEMATRGKSLDLPRVDLLGVW